MAEAPPKRISRDGLAEPLTRRSRTPHACRRWTRIGSGGSRSAPALRPPTWTDWSSSASSATATAGPASPTRPATSGASGSSRGSRRAASPCRPWRGAPRRTVVARFRRPAELRPLRRRCARDVPPARRADRDPDRPAARDPRGDRLGPPDPDSRVRENELSIIPLPREPACGRHQADLDRTDACGSPATASAGWPRPSRTGGGPRSSSRCSEPVSRPPRSAPDRALRDRDAARSPTTRCSRCSTGSRPTPGCATSSKASRASWSGPVCTSASSVRRRSASSTSPATRGSPRSAATRPAADLAAPLARLVQRVSVAHGGKAVKWLGDGVMFHFREPGRAVLAALDMVDGVASDRPAAGARRDPRRAGAVPGGRLLRPDGQRRVADRGLRRARRGPRQPGRRRRRAARRRALTTRSARSS